MSLTRRQFNQGVLAFAAAAAFPLGSAFGAPAASGFDDAYARIVSELARAEEAAHIAGRASSAGGAITWKGRQLESFIGHLDARVDPFQSASQVFRELRDHFDARARQLARDESDDARRLAREMRDYARAWAREAAEREEDSAEPEDGTPT